MKALLKYAVIIGVLLPFSAYATECRAPQLVEDVIVSLDGALLDYQKAINGEGNVCTTMVRRDASTSEQFEAQVRSTANSSLGSITSFLGDIAQPQDFMDDFLQAVPFFDRPYALNYDLDRIQQRMDRLWDMQMKAYSFCQFDRATEMRDTWGRYFDTMRWIKNADKALYNDQSNPFYVGFAPDSQEYSKYAATGFYRHPEQLSCSDEELNLEQVATKLEKVYESLSSAVEEVEHEFAEEIKGYDKTWNDLSRLGNTLNNTLNNLAARSTDQAPKKTVADVQAELREAKGEALNTQELLNQFEHYEQQYQANTDMSRIREEIEAVYQDNTHVALRVQEQELDNIVRIMLAIDGILGSNTASLQSLCDKQAKDITCPPLTY